MSELLSAPDCSWQLNRNDKNQSIHPNFEFRQTRLSPVAKWIDPTAERYLPRTSREKCNGWGRGQARLATTCNAFLSDERIEEQLSNTSSFQILIRTISIELISLFATQYFGFKVNDNPSATRDKRFILFVFVLVVFQFRFGHSVLIHQFCFVVDVHFHWSARQMFPFSRASAPIPFLPCQELRPFLFG